MSSQPDPYIKYDEPELKEGTSVARHISTGTKLSDKQNLALLQKFEENMTLYLLGINLVEPEDKDVEITAKNDKLLMIYTIGRCNPPHDGHIQLFIKNIEHAREAKEANPSLMTKVIFFLGSGPNGGIQTSKDPINFEKKKKVVEYLLSKRGYTPYQSDGSGDYEIHQKDYKDKGQLVTPTLQLVNEVSRLGQENEFNEIQSQLVVGDKDGDATKLNYMLNSFNKSVNSEFPDIHVASEIIAIEPIQKGTVNLSATEIRESAWASKTLEEFIINTNNYYGDMSKEVYDGINEYKPNPITIETKLKRNKTVKARGLKRRSNKRSYKRSYKKGCKRGCKRSYKGSYKKVIN